MARIKIWCAAVRSNIGNRIARLREWVLRFPNAHPFPEDDRDAQILELITCLHRIKDVPAKEVRTSADISVTRFTDRLRLISVGPVLVILAAAGVFWLDVVDPMYPRFAAIVADLILMAVTMFWMALDIGIPFLCLAFPWEFDFRIRRIELAHDLRMAEELRRFDLATLKAGEQWIGMKLERLKFGHYSFLVARTNSPCLPWLVWLGRCGPTSTLITGYSLTSG